MMDVLQLATDPDVISDLYRSGQQNLPNPAFNLVQGVEPDPLLKLVTEMIASGRARPAIPEYVKVSRQLQGMFEAAISGEDTVEDIVQRTAEFVSVIAELPCDSG
jgi:maltose-binding protein MalE